MVWIGGWEFDPRTAHFGDPPVHPIFKRIHVQHEAQTLRWLVRAAEQDEGGEVQGASLALVD